MGFLAVSVIAGLIGTLGMTLFLWLVNKTGIANADMVRALGSGIVRSYEKSLVPGLIVHFAAGIPIAMIYLWVLSLFQPPSPLWTVLSCGIIGFWHGFAFSFVMVILSEHHPVPKFQEAGFEVAFVHFLAHIIYGFVVGGVILITGYNLQ
jgi:hypothetical protein